jgi:hypothetical protein
MGRYAAGARAAGAGSAALPIGSLYGTAAANGRVRETAGTPGTGLTETALDATAAAASCTAFNTHTVAPTLVDAGYRKTMGAAIGDGIIWTFPNEPGLGLAVGTANGIGIYVPNGTGQICDFYIVWDE